MFNTSQDILYLIIAICAGLLTIFVCWIMFYVIMIVRRVYRVTNEIKEKVERFEQAIERSASHLGLMVEIVKELVRYLAGKKKEE